MSLKLQVDRLVEGKTSGFDLKLQLGCGHNLLPDWVNTDSAPLVNADYLDFTRQFPFTGNSFAAVFCEHTIEHVSKAQGLGMVREVFRVLRPGGAFRVVTPGMENFCRMVLEPQLPAAQKYLAGFRKMLNNTEATISDVMNLIFYGHGHQHVYTAEELTSLLRGVGFTEIRVMAGGTYGLDVFKGVDGHGRVVGEEFNAIEAIAVEAVKA